MSNFDNYVYFQEGPGLTSNLFAESGFPFINIRCIENNKLNKKNVQFISDKIANTIYKHFKIESGDILLSTSGSLGKKVKIENQDLPLMLNTSIMRFRSKNTNDLINEYLFYYLESRHLLKQVEKEAQGSAQVNLGPTHFKKFDIYLPNLPTQKRIATILSTVDGQIEKTEAIIAKYQAIKQGMLHDLFTRGIDLSTGMLRPTQEQAPELYKPSPLGLIPKCWDVDMLENLTDKIGSGVTPTGGSEIYRKEGVLFLRSQNILINKLDISDVAYISNKIDESMFSSSVKRFDVLLNITGASIGRCAFFPENLDRANVNQHVCIIRFTTHYLENSIFASEYINSPFIQNQISTLNAGGNREGLNYQQIKSFWFPILPQDEILKIVHIINQVNSKLRNEQNALNKLQKLKQGLMVGLLK